MDEEARRKMAAASSAEMEALSLQLRDLIASQPTKDLLGYLSSQLLMSSLREIPLNERQPLHLALEYVHATLAASATVEQVPRLSEPACVEILKISSRLMQTVLAYCLASSIASPSGIFGPKTAEIEFSAKSTWVLIRGNRYQVLEREFFSFVLAPHDAALRGTYGIGAADIAKGFQAIADSMREGHGRAVERMQEQMDQVSAIASQRALKQEEAIAVWDAEDPARGIAALSALNDLFRGGIFNVSKQSGLPEALLADLAFEIGEERDFFAAGELCGTPLRTLPARIKPLIKLDDGFYATEHAFIRDSGYRALQRGLLGRDKSYREDWNKKQKELSETAFQNVFAKQLQAATIFHEVYYRDPDSDQWIENDALVLCDDILLQIEAKAGVGAMQSPALNFEGHVRSIQRLIVGAYEQSTRFFRYLASASSVPIFQRRQGEFVQVETLTLSNYRLAIPIGLTVESFSPFSAMCKELPQIEPILGKHPFISMAIDDLFVLTRFLPTTAELFHYLEVRQSVAGIRNARLFDEFDHLGAYISKNRFDLDLSDQLSSRNSLVLWDGFSDQIDTYFAQPDWTDLPPPQQSYPEELAALLRALDASNLPGTLFVDSCIRNLGAEGRENFARILTRCRASLNRHTTRWFQIGESPPIMVWLQRADELPDLRKVRQTSQASAIAVGADRLPALIAYATHDGGYVRAAPVPIRAPSDDDPERLGLLAEAERMKSRRVSADSFGIDARKKIGRNDPCWCGSGKKFKKCHGAAEP